MGPRVDDERSSNGSIDSPRPAPIASGVGKRARVTLAVSGTLRITPGSESKTTNRKRPSAAIRGRRADARILCHPIHETAERHDVASFARPGAPRTTRIRTHLDERLLRKGVPVSRSGSDAHAKRSLQHVENVCIETLLTQSSAKLGGRSIGNTVCSLNKPRVHKAVENQRPRTTRQGGAWPLLTIGAATAQA